MIKLIHFWVVFLLCACFVSSYGGDNYTIHLDKCDDLWFNVTGILNIDDNEYSVYSVCSETVINSYYCDCDDNFNLTLGFALNAVNNYTIDVSYDYYKDEVVRSGGGGRSRNRNYAVYESNIPASNKYKLTSVDWNLKKKSTTIVKNDTVLVVPDVPEVNNTPPVLVPDPVEKEDVGLMNFILVVILFLIVITIVVYFIYSHINEKNGGN